MLLLLIEVISVTGVSASILILVDFELSFEVWICSIELYDKKLRLGLTRK